MGYRVDNIPKYVEKVTDRIVAIVCASNGWTRKYFDDNFNSEGDEKVSSEYNRVAAKYGVAIAIEEMG